MLLLTLGTNTVQFWVSRPQGLPVNFETQTQAGICDDSLHERNVATQISSEIHCRVDLEIPRGLALFHLHFPKDL